MANVLAYLFIAALVAGWIYLCLRFKFRWWIVVLSILLFVFLFLSFFRIGGE